VAVVVEKFFNHRFFILIFSLVVVCTHVPSKLLIPAADDYMQQALLAGSDALYSIGFDNANPSIAFGDQLKNGFHFFNSEKGTVAAHREYGNLPWWSVEEGIMHPFRPLAAFTHWIDYNLLDGDLYWIQWHSLVYFLFFSLCGYLFYKSLSRDPLVYGLAVSMLVFDLSVSANLNWIAARNSYLAVAFGILALLWFIRWRETGEKRWLVSSLLVTAVGLSTAEAMVAIVGYFGAYALFLDKKGWFKGCLAVLPFFCVVVVWRLLYSANDFGAQGIGLYFDPGRDLLGFVGQLIAVVPVIGASEILGIDGLITPVSLESWSGIRVASLLVVIGGLFLIRKLIWTTPADVSCYQILIGGLFSCSSAACFIAKCR